MAKSKKRAAPDAAAQKMGFSVKLMLFLIVVAGIIFLRQSFLLPLVGLLPSMVAYITDRVRGRPLFQTVLGCNAAGVMYYVIDLVLKRGNDTAALQHMLQDGKVWLLMYGAAALGYFIYFVAPTISFFFLRMVNQGRLMHLQAVQDKLRRDWGPSIDEDRPPQG